MDKINTLIATYKNHKHTLTKLLNIKVHKLKINSLIKTGNKVKLI